MHLENISLDPTPLFYMLILKLTIHNIKKMLENYFPLNINKKLVWTCGKIRRQTETWMKRCNPTARSSQVNYWFIHKIKNLCNVLHSRTEKPIWRRNRNKAKQESWNIFSLHSTKFFSFLLTWFSAIMR